MYRSLQNHLHWKDVLANYVAVPHQENAFVRLVKSVYPGNKNLTFWSLPIQQLPYSDFAKLYMTGSSMTAIARELHVSRERAYVILEKIRKYYKQKYTEDLSCSN